MATITFYEKPGCINNGKQKKILEQAGHTLLVKDILTHPWKRDELQAYLDSRDPLTIMNSTAPSIKNGTITPSSLSFEEALELMIDEPILIKRPLLDIDGQKMQGFDTLRLQPWLGEWRGKEDVTTCPNLNTLSCDE